MTTPEIRALSDADLVRELFAVATELDESRAESPAQLANFRHLAADYAALRAEVLRRSPQPVGEKPRIRA